MIKYENIKEIDIDSFLNNRGLKMTEETGGYLKNFGKLTIKKEKDLDGNYEVYGKNCSIYFINPLLFMDLFYRTETKAKVKLFN